MGTRVSYTGLKWPGGEADHPPPLVSRLRKSGCIPPFLKYVFMASCLV